jgi:hypothetical protein
MPQWLLGIFVAYFVVAALVLIALQTEKTRPLRSLTERSFGSVFIAAKLFP